MAGISQTPSGLERGRDRRMSTCPPAPGASAAHSGRRGPRSAYPVNVANARDCDCCSRGGCGHREAAGRARDLCTSDSCCDLGGVSPGSWHTEGERVARARPGRPARVRPCERGSGASSHRCRGLQLVRTGRGQAARGRGWVNRGRNVHLCALEGERRTVGVSLCWKGDRAETPMTSEAVARVGVAPSTGGEAKAGAGLHSLLREPVTT